MATERYVPENKGIHAMRAKRHSNGRDMKVVITQRDSETGGGKTTLAVFLALAWDNHGWDGAEKGTVQPEEFLESYPDLPKHSVMVMDEAEELDARRSMQDENIDFSKHWMTMRTRQIDSILTLPTTSALDKRLLELADIRINVVSRGKANVYRVKIDDHSPEKGPQEWFMHEIEWPDLSEHPEYLKLDQQKQDMIDGELSSNEESGADKKREIRAEARALRRFGKSIRDIVDQIDNNPDTGAPWSTETIQRWTEDVEAGGWTEDEEVDK